MTQLIKPEVFFGNRQTGKTTRILQSTSEKLTQNPNFSYTFLGGHLNEYVVDGYEPKPVHITSSGQAFKIQTDADVVILMETSTIDFAFLNHLKNLGKHVLVELDGSNSEEAFSRLDMHKRFFQKHLDGNAQNPSLSDLINIKFQMYGHINIDQTKKKLHSEVLFDINEELTFIECTLKE